MDSIRFLQGLAIGVAMSAPMGPVNVLCIRRTLVHGFWPGLAAGLGAATADTLYGVVAAFGVSMVASFLTTHATPLQVGGGVVLCALGLRTLMAAPPQLTTGPVPTRVLAWGFWSTFLLTLSNPLMLVSLGAIFAAVGLGDEAITTRESIVLCLGVATGAVAWWGSLIAAVDWLRPRIEARGLRWVNVVSGGLLLAGGIAVLAAVSV
ncbi:MAG TPA: LysE family transporter [Candidatus Binatia bacterium]|nr:LysE family transporter [Candidatus Binatia bacterium]